MNRTPEISKLKLIRYHDYDVMIESFTAGDDTIIYNVFIYDKQTGKGHWQYNVEELTTFLNGVDAAYYISKYND